MEVLFWSLTSERTRRNEYLREGVVFRGCLICIKYALQPRQTHPARLIKVTSARSLVRLKIAFSPIALAVLGCCNRDALAARDASHHMDVI